MGGLCFDTVRDMTQAKIIGDELVFEKLENTSEEHIKGRQCHSSVALDRKIYTFGGCFMYNPKR